MKLRDQNTCQHGVYHPKKIVHGKWKCLECYQEYMLQCQRHEEEKKRLLQHQLELKEYHDKYIQAACSIRKRASSAMLASADGIRALDPYSFEDFCAKVYRGLGYEVIQTPKTNDGGKDAIAFKDGKKILIECKHYEESATIGRPFLQKFYAAMVEEKAKVGHYIATCKFSKDAIEYAQKFGIVLIDMEQLCSMAHISKGELGNFSFSVPCLVCGEPVQFTAFGDVPQRICKSGHIVKNPAMSPTEPHCPKCDSPLKLIAPHRYSSRYGSYHSKKFYGCSSYPNCSFRMSVEEFQYKKSAIMGCNA